MPPDPPRRLQPIATADQLSHTQTFPPTKNILYETLTFDMKQELLQLGSSLCVSTLCLPDITTRHQISQAFPLHICILQPIIYWSWEQLENKANDVT